MGGGGRITSTLKQGDNYTHVYIHMYTIIKNVNNMHYIMIAVYTTVSKQFRPHLNDHT